MLLLTQSELTSHADCPLGWNFKYVENLRPKVRSVKLAVGGAVHRGVEAFYNREENPLETVKEYCANVRRQAVERGILLDDDFDVQLEKAVIMSEIYFDVYRNDLDIYDVNEVEYKFEVPIPGMRGIRITGKMDRLMTHKESGILHLTETKTAAQWDSDINRLMLDFQISLYAWAISKIFKQEDVLVLYDVIRKPMIRIKKDEDNQSFLERVKSTMNEDREKYFIRHKILRSKHEIERTEDEIRMRAREIRRMRKERTIYRTPGDHCSWKCDFRKVCIENTPEMKEALYLTADDIHEELRPQTNFA